MIWRAKRLDGLGSKPSFFFHVMLSLSCCSLHRLLISGLNTLVHCLSISLVVPDKGLLQEKMILTRMMRCCRSEYKFKIIIFINPKNVFLFMAEMVDLLDCQHYMKLFFVFNKFSNLFESTHNCFVFIMCIENSPNVNSENWGWTLFN